MPSSHFLSPTTPASALHLRDTRLGDVLRRQRRERPDAIAFQTPTRDWTYAEADTAANRIAQACWRWVWCAATVSPASRGTAPRARC